MRWGLLALLVSFTLVGCAARTALSNAPGVPYAVSAQDIQQEFQPDRPDVANSTHVVPVGLLQLETGGEWQDVSARTNRAGVPLSIRLGLQNWFEARVETFADVYESTPGLSRGLNGVSIGAKVSFSSAFAIIPAVQLPVGAQDGTDVLVTLITGTDFAGANHVDANYGLAAISGAAGHLFQQWLAISVNRQVTGRFSPYAEIYWYSRQDPGGRRVVSTDFGFIYTLTERLAFDAGADLGLNARAPRARLFGGLSVVMGEMFGRRGVHARLREAAERHAGGAR